MVCFCSLSLSLSLSLCEKRTDRRKGDVHITKSSLKFYFNLNAISAQQNISLTQYEFNQRMTNAILANLKLKSFKAVLARNLNNSQRRFLSGCSNTLWHQSVNSLKVF